MPTTAAKCPHCGLRVSAPPSRSEPNVSCPHCATPANAVRLGPVELDVCPDCGSTWFDTAELESTRDAADGLAGDAFRAAVRDLRPRLATLDARAYVDCPVCCTPLALRAHPQVAGVVAHACSDHGAWVQRPHLLRLLDELEKVGATELARRRRTLADVERRLRDVDHDLHAQYDRRQFAAIVERSVSAPWLWFWF